MAIRVLSCWDSPCLCISDYHCTGMRHLETTGVKMPKLWLSYSKLGHILFGHPTTTRYSEFGALYCQRHTLNMDPREVAFNNAIRDLNAGIFRS